MTADSMRTYPEIGYLPPAPAGASGWPWVEERPEYMPTRLDGRPWPKITVVTPSLDHAGALEQTIRSVLLQRYPNLEYIISGARSTDESREIIRKYERWTTYVDCGPTAGKARAINKGISMATGDVVNWVEPGDLLTEGALGIVGRFSEQVDVLAGGRMITGEGEPPQHRLSRGLNARLLLRGDTEVKLQQLATWVHREKALLAGLLDEGMQHTFNRDFYVRYLHLFPNVRHVNIILGCQRRTDRSRSTLHQNRLIAERLKTTEKLRTDPAYEELWPHCDVAREKYFWRQRLTDTVNDPDDTAVGRAARILSDCRHDPDLRWDAVTKRALRGLILGRELRPYVART